MPVRECAQSRWVLIVKSGDIQSECEKRGRSVGLAPVGAGGLGRNWAVKSRFVYWKTEDIPNTSQQPNPVGTGTITVPTADNGSIQERRAVHFELQRRLRNNWTMAANYVWSKTEGNCSDADSGQCQDAYGAMLNAIDPATGDPISLSNRYGLIATDRTHVFKVRGAYIWPITQTQRRPGTTDRCGPTCAM